MWRPGRSSAGLAETDRGDDIDPAERATGIDAAASAAVGIETVHAVASEPDRLRTEAADLGGRSSLLQYLDVPDAGIDITSAHPGGLPQFITGKPTLLSGLFRDEVALLTARRAAEQVTAKNIELRAVRQLDAVRLAVGLAHWRIGGVSFCAPVLLRPLAIRRRGTDVELKLHGRFEINPELVHAARDHFGIALDGQALAALAHDDGIFKPQRVIDRLRSLTSHLDAFRVQPRLIVSTFADVGRSMARDLVTRGRGYGVALDALTGASDARQALHDQPTGAPLVGPDDRAPAADALLLDADGEQEQVLAHVAAGRSFVLQTLPGTGGMQTVINAIGVLVGDHRRVLVVAPRHSSAEGVRHRLRQIGLDGLGTAAADASRDVIRAIGRNEKASAPDIAEVDDALVRLRGLLAGYRSALAARDPRFEVSPLEALTALAEIHARSVAEQVPPPSTTARFDLDTTRRLAAARASAAETLVQSARLGEFRFGPGDSPWYGARFTASAEVERVHALAGRLHGKDLPRLISRGFELIKQTPMRPFASIDELGEYLRLLAEIGESLDRFQLAAFERPLAEVIRAIGPRRDAEGMRAADRNRLRRIARDLVRPGVHVGDVHEGLVRIAKQRAQWQRYVEAGVLPEIPLGIADVQVAWQKVVADLGELDVPLQRTGADRLAAQPIDRLVRTLAALAAESEILDNLIERTQLRADLASQGLEPLLAELSVRHVPADRVATEFEFAWWASALEHMLRGDKRLLGANTAVIDRLERDFRLVDEAHAAAAGPALAHRLAQEWAIALVDHPAEASALKEVLRAGVAAPRALADAAPHLLQTLSPVWVASPYDVPKLAEGDTFDAVIVMDAASINLAEAAPALRRARQVIAIGDPVTQRPSPFAIALGAPTEPARSDGADAFEGELPFDEVSLFERLADLLPVYSLTRSYRAGGEDLAELVNAAFYGGEIASLPWAGSYLGRGSLSVDYVAAGTGTPDPLSGAVESPDAEVSRVVTLVLEHALNRPRETLMVVTASKRHAERVRAAVAHALTSRADVEEFVRHEASAHRGAEPFVVLTIEEAVAESRDRVIFSLGFGVTRHGRVLSDFGDLSSDDGERLLTVAMTRARRSMVIVSCIRPQAIEAERLTHGAALLMEMLTGVEDREVAERARQATSPLPTDPLSRHLVEHLRELGVQVDVDYRGLPLVARHGGTAVVIDVDPVEPGSSLREALRLRPQLLRRLGWHYARVHAFDLYADPQSVALRVASIVGVTAEMDARVTARAAAPDQPTEPLDLQP